jgi:hypothetical protein
MKKKQLILAMSVMLMGVSVFAVSPQPKFLITNNSTDVESNAYVDSVIPSQHPSKAHSTTKVSWLEVRLACYQRAPNGICSALVKMETGPNDGGHPVDVGIISMNLNTGAFLQNKISGNGYTVTVNGPGETTITKD